MSSTIVLSVDPGVSHSLGWVIVDAADPTRIIQHATNHVKGMFHKSELAQDTTDLVHWLESILRQYCFNVCVVEWCWKTPLVHVMQTVATFCALHNITLAVVHPATVRAGLSLANKKGTAQVYLQTNYPLQYQHLDDVHQRDAYIQVLSFLNHRPKQQ
jgi:Holliday junction resolvasome RuvABC endonuclease subunit